MCNSNLGADPSGTRNVRNVVKSWDIQEVKSIDHPTDAQSIFLRTDATRNISKVHIRKMFHDLIGEIIFENDVIATRYFDAELFDDTNPRTWFTVKDLENNRINNRLVQFLRTIGLLGGSFGDGFHFKPAWDDINSQEVKLSTLYLNLCYTCRSKKLANKILSRYIHPKDLQTIQDIYQNQIDLISNELKKNMIHMKQGRNFAIISYLPNLSDIAEIEALIRALVWEQSNLRHLLKQVYPKKSVRKIERSNPACRTSIIG